MKRTTNALLNAAAGLHATAARADAALEAGDYLAFKRAQDEAIRRFDVLHRAYKAFRAERRTLQEVAP